MTKDKSIITIFIHCFPPAKGGLEQLTGEIKKILEKEYEVHIITGQGLTLDSYKSFSNLTTDNSGHVHRLKLNYFWQRIANKFLNKIIFKIGFFSPFYFGPILKYTSEVKRIISKSDLIIGAGMPTKMFYDSFYYAKKYNKKLILHPSYHNVSYYNNCFLFQQALTFASKIIYQTDQEKKGLNNHYHIDNKKFVRLAFNEYTKEQLHKQQQELPTIITVKQNHFKNKTITLGFVGQITRRKNLTVLKEYLDQYLPYWQNNNYHIRLLLAGAKTNTSKEIKKLFLCYIKNDTVKIIYNFQAKNMLFKQIDIFINPSLEESLGIVNFESIFYGIPTFVQRKSAFAEMTRSPFLFNSINSLHTKLKTILYNPSTLPRLVNQQRNVFQEYNYDAYSYKLRKLLSSL